MQCRAGRAADRGKFVEFVVGVGITARLVANESLHVLRSGRTAVKKCRHNADGEGQTNGHSKNRIGALGASSVRYGRDSGGSLDLPLGTGRDPNTTRGGAI